MLYDANNNPIREDTRTPFQKEFDRQFRSGDGGHLIKRAAIQALQREIEIREKRDAELKAHAPSESKPGPGQKLVSDMYDEKLLERKSREHPVIISIPKSEKPS